MPAPNLQVTQIEYPPLDSQATYTFIDTHVPAANQTGSINDDFKLALANLLSLDVSKYSIDDLWRRYIVAHVATDGNAKSGNPAARGKKAGQHLGHYYDKDFRKNAGNNNSLPGGQFEPTFANVKFLALGEGADEATTYTTEDNGARTLTFANQAKLDSAVTPKFNATTAFLFDGTGDYCTAPDSADFDIGGATDFTMEAWIYFNSRAGTFQCMSSQYGGFTTQQGHIWRIESTGQMQYLNRLEGTTQVQYVSTANATLTTGQWYHAAVVRDTSNEEIRHYLDGAIVGDPIECLNTVDYQNATGLFYLGAQGASLYSFNGLIEGFRYTVGEVGYSGTSYNVPTSAFPTS